MFYLIVGLILLGLSIVTIILYLVIFNIEKRLNEFNKKDALLGLLLPFIMVIVGIIYLFLAL